MGSLPTQSQLEKRAKEAQDKLRDLKVAYDNFINQWEKIEKEEAILIKQAHQHLDANKMQTILTKIHDSKN